MADNDITKTAENAPEEVTPEEGKKELRTLDKKTLTKTWRRLYFCNEGSLSYQWLMAIGECQGMIPVIRKLYGGDKKKEVEALRRYSTFYSCEPQIGNVVEGIMCGLEEEKANGKDLDGEVITDLRIGLMGPIAGIGDSLIPGMYIPILLAIALGLSSGGSVAGAIFYAVVWITSMTLVSYKLFFRGYHMGTKAVDLLSGERSLRIRDAFNLLGSVVVGAVGASYTKLETIVQIPAGDGFISLNDTLNNILPGILPLTLILVCWWLVAKKNVSPLKVMLLLLAVAIVGTVIGLF